jgi:diguanylate cyclase (GGDEF)-like protein
MTGLKLWYREHLPPRIAALEEVREQLQGRTPGSVEAIRRIAHSLRGSGDTYGFPEISASAQLVEEAEELDLVGAVQALIHTLKNVHAGGLNEKARILVVEDDEDQSRFIAATLAASDREILEARSAEEAQTILDEHEISLILLDLILPDTDGRNFLSRLRERFATATVPVIVLTVKRASEAKAECFALGADDFIEKPVMGEALKERVAGRLRSSHGGAREFGLDSLTGLANRAAFHEAFKRMRAEPADVSGTTTAAMVVLDGFEEWVGRRGSGAGDAAVGHAARVLSRTFRSCDVLARFSGCEFTVLFPGTGASGAAIALGKALEALKECPLEYREEMLRLGFSAGIATLAPGKTLEEVLSEADRHLHLAQEQGGGRIVSGFDRPAPLPRRILIADDDELIRMVLERHFEREGYETASFADGRAALQGAREGSFSLVVTDGTMPVMDGFELVTRLRSIPEYTAVPIIMLTSMGGERDIVHGFDAGVDDYVIKPFSASELMARVRRLLKRSPLRA